jgi:hypothetical protein
MKTFTSIILVAGLTAGVFNLAEAQRGRGGNRIPLLSAETGAIFLRAEIFDKIM